MTTVTIADVKPYLNLTTTDNDSLVADVVAQAEEWVIDRCGPLVSTNLTKRVERTGCSLMLPVYPVLSVTSVTGVDTGTVVTLETDDINLRTGIITPDTWPSADYAFTVVYVAGRTAVPEQLRRAVIEMSRYLWRPQRGAGQRQGDAGDNMAALRMAEFLIQPYAIVRVA